VPSKDPALRFADILTNIERIEAYIAGIENEESFEDNHLVYDAVERCLQRISEAASKLGDEASLLCPGIPWASIRGLGNVLRHDYDQVESVRLWYTVQDNLPLVKTAVKGLLQRIARENP
jgi:uncharacterized protein with HEPN domain